MDTTRQTQNRGAEIIGTLLKISMVSRRLAANLKKLYDDDKGGKTREQDE